MQLRNIRLEEEAKQENGTMFFVILQSGSVLFKCQQMLSFINWWISKAECSYLILVIISRHMWIICEFGYYIATIDWNLFSWWNWEFTFVIYFVLWFLQREAKKKHVTISNKTIKLLATSNFYSLPYLRNASSPMLNAHVIRHAF